MHSFLGAAAVMSASLLSASAASAALITFEDLAVGTTLSNQYAGLGVIFSPNAFSGPSPSSSGQDWATDTDMTVVSSVGTDVGGLGTPSLVSGNILRSFNGWLNEDGDPSFLMTFTSAISSISLDFAGVTTPSDVTLYAYDGALLLGTASGTTTGQFNLSFNAASITKVAIAPGSFDDWVGVDNISFTSGVVPEPASWAMMLAGFGAIGCALRRRRSLRVRVAI
jgi:hypothetical protein